MPAKASGANWRCWLNCTSILGEQRIEVVVQRKRGPWLPIHQAALNTGAVL